MVVRRLPRRPRSVRSTKDRFGSFLGMRDSADPPSADAQLARMLRNCYPLIAGHHARVVGRPGCAQMGAQLGSSGRRTGQLFYQFTKLDGTEYTVAIVGGHFYTLNWATETWTEVVTAANFTTASITLSQTARCYAVTLGDEMIVSDGVNTPWSWDGTTGASGLTSLTNCPVLFGPPTVYYAKLFGIKANERSTAVWSEENDPATGYEAGGYNNAWTIGQTDTNRLTRLLGANEALYVFRERSATLVTGPVNNDFTSSGTRDGVSSTLGTASPDSVFFVGPDVMFADADGRPHLIRRGLEPMPVWEDFSETINAISDLDEIQGFWDPTLDFARMAYAGGRQLCWSHRNKALRAASVFDGLSYDRIGVVENADGAPRILHASDGYVYVHGTKGGALWSDDLAGGETAIVHQIEPPMLGYDEETEKHWDRLDLMFHTPTDLSNVSVRIRTGYGAGSALPSDVEAAEALWDEAFWDVDEWSSESGGVYHAATGLDAHGAFLDLSIQHDTLGERFGFLTGKLTGRPLGNNPVMP